jgi:hypothetical protein
MAVQFSVDKSGPPRPSIVSVTSSQTDPNPGDLFTSIVNPTVVLSGQAGQTVVIHGPNGIVDPADYTVTETNGIYTITFTTNQVRGDYKVNLRDSNGNENADGSGAQNFFRIDSIPILFDNPLRRPPPWAVPMATWEPRTSSMARYSMCPSSLTTHG